MHRIDIIWITVVGSVGIIFSQPNGRDRSMASLSYDATKRPGINQISPKHHVLNQNVGCLLRLYSGVVRCRNGISFSGLTHGGGAKWMGFPNRRVERKRRRRWKNPRPWTWAEANGFGDGECESRR